MKKSIRVLLADDHPLVRAGLLTTLSADKDLILVGEATNGHEAQNLSQKLKPDVLLLDLSMPGPSPVETVTRLAKACPQTKVLVLTAFDDEVYARSLMATGASGYVLKDEAPETLVSAIRTVRRGDTWLSHSVSKKLAPGQADSNLGEAKGLNQRERQILEMISRGWSNARIETELNLAHQTVRNYVSRIYFKIGVKSRAEASRWACEHLPLAVWD